MEGTKDFLYDSDSLKSFDNFLISLAFPLFFAAS